MRRTVVHDAPEKAGIRFVTSDRVQREVNAEQRAVAAARPFSADISSPANLATQRSYRLQFLLPHGPNAFMENLTNEVRKHAHMLRHEQVDVHIEPIDAYDGHRVTGTLAILDKSVCDGVAVVAPPFPEVRAAIDRLQDRGVHVITLVSDHPASTRQRFVGIDNTDAGRTAGSLLGRFLPKAPGKIGVIAGSLGLHAQAGRHAGFSEVLSTEFPHLEILKVREGRDDSGRNEDIVRKLLCEHPDIAGLYNIGAGNRGVISALRESGRGREIIFVGHELTPYTRDALSEGTMDAVIAQNPGHEARSAIRILKALCDGAEILNDQESIGIDIFMKDNLPKLP